MFKRIVAIAFAWLVLLVISCGGRDDNKNDDPTLGEDIQQTRKGDGGIDQEGVVIDEKPSTCGNGHVDEDQREQCDDGNEDDTDGCTSLCEFTCTDDEGCDDLDSCNGKEICIDHKCQPGEDSLSDGEPCDDNASCYQGECLEHECGNSVKQADEECDDGNTDDADGCTKECLFTCYTGDRWSTVVNDCNPSATCDEKSHTWKGGSPLEDGTVCARKEGYCSNGVCVLADCGDGNQEPNEECDLGEKNGLVDSGCTDSCRLAVCGNGKIEANELCDDGNNDNLDGCDSQCLAEVTYRGTSMLISLEDAPSFCIHSGNANNGNAFGSLFPDQSFLDLVNVFVQDGFINGEVHTLFHTMDIENYKPDTEDPLIRLGLSMGEPKEDWLSRESKVDFPFNTYKEYFDENLLPLTSVLGEMVVEDGTQLVRSTAPVTSGFLILDMEFILHDMMARIETDGIRSRLPAPPETIEDLEVPESVGAHGTGQPSGVICGALHESSFETIPLPESFLILCLDQLGQYVGCATDEDLLAGNCDSLLDLFKGGCSDLGGLVTFLKPLGEPDVDTDGVDGTDSYSVVLKVSAERVKVEGAIDRPEEDEAQ